jgi:hypothetical protein
VDGENDVNGASELAEALGPRVVHPKLPFEVDLASGVAAILEEGNRFLRTLA